MKCKVEFGSEPSGLLTEELNSALSISHGQNPLSFEIYSELHRIAVQSLRRERRHHTLQPTDLVHDAYLQLHGSSLHLESRGHFFRIASRAMRHLLIAHARKRHAAKRCGNLRRLVLTDVPLPMKDSSVDLLGLNDALEVLEKKDPRKATLVELKFFGGCSTEECARALQISTATVEREWRFTRVWLMEHIEESKT